MPIPEQVPGEDFADRVQRALNQLVCYVSTSRNFLSLIHDTLNASGDPVTTQSLKKIVEKGETLPLVLEEFKYFEDVVNQASVWEEKVDKVLAQGIANPNQKPSLFTIWELLLQANKLPFSLKSTPKLEERVAKALQISALVSQGGKSMSLRTSQTLLRDAQRTNLSFPALKILSDEVDRAENFYDKASKAGRLRVAYEELCDLLHFGKRNL